MFGRSTSYDFRPVVKFAETDTSVRLDEVERTFIFNAEKHIDTIYAKSFGAILHLTDIADVSGNGLKDFSMLVYKKDSDCGEGCVGVNNSWNPWNALDNLEASLQHVMGFDGDGAPVALAAPQNTDQFYSLSWAASGKVSYTQDVEVATPPMDDDGASYLRFLDPSTKQEVYLKVFVSIDDNGNVTFNTKGEPEL